MQETNKHGIELCIFFLGTYTLSKCLVQFDIFSVLLTTSSAEIKK